MRHGAISRCRRRPEPNGDNDVARGEIADGSAPSPRRQPVANPVKVDRTSVFIGNFDCLGRGLAPPCPCQKRKPTAFRTSTPSKEIVMNEELQLEIVELGDAKEETKGFPTTQPHEESPQVLRRQES
jgi:uncharacterized protein DUF5974